MFELIEKETEIGEVLFITNTNTGEGFSILPEWGSNLNSLTLKSEEQLFNIISSKKSKEDFKTTKIFNGAFLFPFPNRLRKGEYCYNNELYKIPINDPPNALHGLLYDKKFNLIETSCNKEKGAVKLSYKPDKKLSGYPFNFEIINSFELSNNGIFELRTEVINNDMQSIPLGLGWHPYFNFNEKIDISFLQIPESKIIIVDEDKIPTGEYIPLQQFKKKSPIGETGFDTCFKITEFNKTNTIKLTNNSNKTTINIELPVDGNFKYFQLYIPHARDEIAIEPMSCNIDAFNNNDGLINLNPDERISFYFKIYLSGNES